MIKWKSVEIKKEIIFEIKFYSQITFQNKWGS